MIEHDVNAALTFAERITLLHYGKVIVEGSRNEGVADDVAILNTGRIVFDGTAEELRAKPELLQANLGVF